MQVDREASARWLRQTIVGAVAVLTASLAISSQAMAASGKPGHVFIIVLENKGFNQTFGPLSPASFLKSLVRKGAVLRNYYGIGHFSLDNYIAMVSGQAPNPVTQADCQSYVDFVSTGTDADGQAIGQGCVYPGEIKTIVDQIQAKNNGLTWKAYMEDMGNNPSRESRTCGHPPVGSRDNTQKASNGDQYATRHNPFMYFHSVIDDRPNCDAHVVDLSVLAKDLSRRQSTPNYVFITPNLCHDAHDAPCVNGEPGGLVSADKFLSEHVPSILNAPAFKEDGLLIVTFDEADIDIDSDGNLTGGDASACCDEPNGPNIGPGSKLVFGPNDTLPDKGPGVVGPGGGRIGAVLVSPFIKPGTESAVEYNHYSLLKSLEDYFGLDYLGYAGHKGLRTFGTDVFSAN